MTETEMLPIDYAKLIAASMDNDQASKTFCPLHGGKCFFNCPAFIHAKVIIVSEGYLQDMEEDGMDTTGIVEDTLGIVRYSNIGCDSPALVRK
jgi:hypothetical protein